jgi:hypothetical protein
VVVRCCLTFFSPSVHLRTVLVHQCVDLTNEGVEHLSVGRATMITVARECPRVACSLISRAPCHCVFVHRRCGRLNGLYDLGLDELSQLSNAALLSIAHHCPHLRRLSMSRSPHITYHALHTLVQRCADLVYLNCALATQVTAVSSTHADPIWQDLLQKIARRGVHFLR